MSYQETARFIKLPIDGYMDLLGITPNSSQNKTQTPHLKQLNKTENILGNKSLNVSKSIQPFNPHNISTQKQQ